MAEETEVKVTKKTKTRKGWKVARKVFVLLLIIGLAVFGGYYFKKYNDLKNHPLSAEEAQKQENRRIKIEVGKLYSIPKDEEPDYAFVRDKNQLTEDQKKQDFFQKAENGDYILVFNKAKIAILYRPSTKQVIAVSPTTVQGGSNNQSGPSVAIIGVQTNRDSVEKTLKDKFKDKVIIGVKKDSTGNYGSIVVVDLSGKNIDNAKVIATALGGQVGELPPGEEKPAGADILVVAGSPSQ